MLGRRLARRTILSQTLPRRLLSTSATSSIKDSFDVENFLATASATQSDTKTGVMRFPNLQNLVRATRAVDESFMKQTMGMNGYAPIRYLGEGRFGKVFLTTGDPTLISASPEIQRDTTRLSARFAVKVINVERDRREFNWTWLTSEERQQSHRDSAKLAEFIETLEPGLVHDHMVRAQQLMLDTLKREENPLLRRVRRPVAEREILLRIGPHPFVANLLGSFRDNRFLYLVFDFFELGNLGALLQTWPGSKAPEEVARFFASQLLLSLEFLASKNVTHRDVKPSNILLSPEGWIALADFGLATRLKGGLKTFCGTAEYVAPEVLSERMWSAGFLDMWAWGITLYAMVVGKTPFEAPDATSVFLNTLTSPLVFPPDMSPELRDLLERVLSRDYSKRPTIATVKQHAFFKGVDWDALKEKKIPIPLEVTTHVERALFETRKRLAETNHTGLRRPTAASPHIAAAAAAAAAPKELESTLAPSFSVSFLSDVPR